jgi:hypothetical protein
VSAIVSGKQNPTEKGEVSHKLTRRELRQLIGAEPVGLHEVLGVDVLPDLQAEDAVVSYPADGKTKQVKVSELRQTLRQLHDENVLDTLLAVKGPAIPEKMRPNPRYTYMVLFILVMIVIWCGCNNAAKEIVKEEAVFSRERAVNLGIVPYLASKFLVQTVVTVFQSALLMGMVFGTQEALAHFWPGRFSSPLIPQHMVPYPELFGVLVMLSMAGVSMGLLLSACVNSPDKANALLPYVLIPQMLLGGGFLPIRDGVMFWLAAIGSPVYWAYRAVRHGGHEFPESFPYFVSYHERALLPCQVLAVETIIMLLVTAWFLRRKGA